MIKVLMVADYPVGGEQIDGGVQAVSAYIVNGLKKRQDIKLTVLSFKSGINEIRRISENGVNVYQLPRANRGHLSFFNKDFMLFQKALEEIKPDLIHAQGATMEGYVACRSGLPTVVTFHGIIGEDAKYKSTFKERLRFRIISWVAERYCVKHNGPKILISPYVARYYGNRLKGKCIDIANPIHDSFYRLPEEKQTGRILYAGKIIRRKGVLDLVKALSCLPSDLDFSLHLAGAPDDQEYVNLIKEEIKRGNLEERIKFLGLINENRVLEEFSKASILALPSYQETAPMVIQQAMAAGVVVLATDVCGVPDQLDGGKLGRLFPPGDVESCAMHLKELLSDETSMAALARKARIKAQKDYHVDSVVAKTIALYQETVGAS